MTKRPRSLTILSWILMGFGTVQLIMIVLQLNSPELQAHMQKLADERGSSAGLVYGMMFAGMFVLISSGLGIHRGSNWSRWLFTLWGSGTLLVNLYVGNITTASLPGVAIFGFVVFLLFRPGVRDFFRKNRGEVAEAHQSPV